MAYDTPEDVAVRQRLGNWIARSCDSPPRTRESVAAAAGVTETDLDLLIAGRYEPAWDHPRRHQLQQALGWAPGSWERILQGDESAEPLHLPPA